MLRLMAEMGFCVGVTYVYLVSAVLLGGDMREVSGITARENSSSARSECSTYCLAMHARRMKKALMPESIL